MEKTKHTRITSIAAILAFAAGAWVLLALVYADYMHKVEGLQLFVGTSIYFQQCMAIPGGLITWCSTFLTQAMINQYIGAAVMVAVLLAMQVAAIKALNLPRSWWAASTIFPALALLSFLRLGYDIFVIKPLGYAFALPLGMLISMLLLWGYRLIADWRVRSLAILAIVVVGYHFLGFYALLSAAMCACYGIVDIILTRNLSALTPAAVAVALIAVLPHLYYMYCARDLMASQVYVSPLPRFFASEPTQWGLYALIFAIMVAASIFAGRMGRLKPLISAAVWCACVAAVLLLRCSDRNLMHTLAIDRALWQQDWPRAAELAKSIDFEPTRMNTALGIVAMLRNGRCADELFQAKYGWAPYNTTRKGDPMHDAGAALISYHLGLVNYAYRWATEYMIEQGMGAERMKMMVKCALLNYETELAKHYLDILYNVPNHREWARKYSKFVTNPLEMSRDGELMAVKALMCQPSKFINDGGTIEGYVWPLLATAPAATPQFTELSICAALINRDLDSAIEKIPAYASASYSVPRYMQEAMLYWAQSNKVASPIKIDPQVERRFSQFFTAFRNTSDQGAEAQRELLKADYGVTLWYYLVFTEDKAVQ